MVQPFSALDVLDPDILEIKVKWEQERSQVAQIEQQKFLSGEDFYDEPENYPWCQAWTDKGDRNVIDPVTGEKNPVYVLCAKANRKGDCELFEPI